MYKIIRFSAIGMSKVIKTVDTLEEARAHCEDPETSSRTCTSDEGLELTSSIGSWFDGYTEC